jgi:amidase
MPYILLGVLAGTDAADSYTLKNKAEKDYTKYLDVNGLNGKRIGIQKLDNPKPATKKLLDDAIAILKKQGAEIVEVELNKQLKEIGGAEFQYYCFMNLRMVLTSTWARPTPK